MTVPAGAPPTGTPAQETLLTTLISFGNLSDANRHCELVASVPAGARVRTYYLGGGAGSGGLWTTDVAGEPQVSTTSLRTTAAGPLSFLCAPLDSGVRLGADRDEDTHLNGSDCAPADEGTFAMPGLVMNLQVLDANPPRIIWGDQSGGSGSGVHYDVAGGSLSDLQTGGFVGSAFCVAGNLVSSLYDLVGPSPPAGDGFYYLVRARNNCGTASFGPGREAIDGLCIAR